MLGIGKINRNEILDMPTRDFYYLWDSLAWVKPYELETQIGNRIISAIVNSGMIEDKKQAVDGLMIVDPVWEEHRLNEEIDSLTEIGK